MLTLSTDLRRVPDAPGLRAGVGERVRVRAAEALHRVHGRHPVPGPGRYWISPSLPFAGSDSEPLS